MATKAQFDAIVDGMATKAQLDAMMARMNNGFERVVEKQQTLQVASDTLGERVTRLEQDVRQLRGGI